MKKQEFIICDCCGEAFHNDTVTLRQNFRRYSSKEKGYGFHTTCKLCEDITKEQAEWKDGLLRCHICGEYFPQKEFGVSDHYPYRNNRDARCSKCRSKQALSTKRKYSGEYGLLKTIQMRFLCARERAQKYNIPFNITKDYLKQLWDQQHGLCAISQIPMTYIQGNGRTSTNVSIDQINPRMGYTVGNVQLVCMAVNQMKSDLSMEELYTFCAAILKNKD